MGEPELTQILNQIKQFQNCRATGEHNLVHFPERTELNHISPTESKESAECGTSSESPNSEPRRKERKDRKKVDQISYRLQAKNSPNNSKVKFYKRKYGICKYIVFTVKFRQALTVLMLMLK